MATTDVHKSQIEGRIQAHFPFVPESGASIVMMAYAGSQAHGTHDPQPGSIDDIDVVGAILPPPAEILGFRLFEHWDDFIEELDITFYSLRKLVRLWLKANPNVLGWLWLPDHLYLLRTEAFDQFRANRHFFASKRAYLLFKHYGQAQLRDMDRGVYRGYMGAKRKLLVEQFGYDVKPASHAIRILRSACEFLETGEMHVDRTNLDADELKAIKRGEWPRDRVLREADALFGRLEEAYQHSPLPDEPDEAAALELLVDVTVSHLKKCLR